MQTIDLSKYNTKAKPVNPGKRAESINVRTLLNTEIKLFEKKFGNKQKEWLYSELGLLLSAGVDIKTSFEILEKEMTEAKHKKMLQKIKDTIISGASITSSFKQVKGVFSTYEAESIRIGEETGKLPEVLIELGKYYSDAIKLKRQIIGTLTYPIVVISLSIGIVYFMLSFVVPMFSDIFKQTGGQLPAITQFLIKVSNKSSFIFYTILTITISFMAMHKLNSAKPWYRKITSDIVLKIPLINQLVNKIYLARFCQSMRLLLSSKVLLIDALGLVKNMINYYPIESALHQVTDDVLKGKQLHESLSSHKIFPQKLVGLIKVSEEVNAPEQIFLKLSLQYSDEIEHQQAIIGKVIEPFFIIVLGLIIGFILVAMYLPLFQLSNGF